MPLERREPHLRRHDGAVLRLTAAQEREHRPLHPAARQQVFVAGVLDDQVPGFDTVDMLVRDYARQVTERPQYMRDAIFEELRQHFTQAQIVELTLRIALCGFFNRFNDALQIDMEEGVAAGVPAAGVLS